MKRLNKKGFTLVELLAVIVVLAVIMVIATQQVNGTIARSRSNSFIDTYHMVVRQAKTFAAQDVDPDTTNPDADYGLSKDYSLTITCQESDTCDITLTASEGDKAKFKNMDLTKYGDAAESGSCVATKIGSGAATCTAKEIQGTFKK